MSSLRVNSGTHHRRVTVFISWVGALVAGLWLLCVLQGGAAPSPTALSPATNLFPARLTAANSSPVFGHTLPTEAGVPRPSRSPVGPVVEPQDHPQHWNQFRGNRGDGHSPSAALPLNFAEGSPEIVWKTDIPGKGWSSPVVWEKQVWVTTGPEVQNPPGLTDFAAIPDTPTPELETPILLSAIGLDLNSGQKIYDIPVFAVTRPQFTHQTNSYASPTSVIEQDRLYVHFGTYGTACIDTTNGKILWHRSDLHCHHWRGAGSSPIVHHDLLYLSFDGYDQQFIVALNKRSGETVWQRNRDIDFGTDDGDAKKAYSTPHVIAVEGKEMLISPHAAGTTAYDPASGETLWVLHHPGMNAAARPLFGNNLLYINVGDARESMLAIDPTGIGPRGEDHVRWRLGRMTPKRPSQLLAGERLFLLEDKGVLACLDARTGDVLGSSRISGNYWASPILAGDRIYACSQEGKVSVIAATPDFEVLATNQLDEGMIASPAVAGNSLILRTFKSVYRIENTAGQ